MSEVNTRRNEEAKQMDENPYEAPQVKSGARLIRVRIRWWPIVLFIIVVALLAALILPALEPGRSSNERQYREWKRQRESEQSVAP